MKKHLLLLVMFLFVACGKNELGRNQNSETKSSESLVQNEIAERMPVSNKISAQEALKIATEAPLKYLGAKSTSKIALSALPIVESAQKGAAADTLMYLVNYANGGYAFVSTDRRSSEVIAFVPEGQFSIADTANNSLKKYLYEQMVSYQLSRFGEFKKADNNLKLLLEDEFSTISGPAKGPGGAPGPIGPLGPTTRTSAIGPRCQYIIEQYDPDWDDMGHPVPSTHFPSGAMGDPGPDDYYLNNGCRIIVKVPHDYVPINKEPLLTTKWHQDAPFNGLAPKIQPSNERAIAGCVPVAIAQIMTFHEYPTGIPVGNTYGGYVSYISALKNLKYGYQFTNVTYKGAVQRLLRSIGDNVVVNWGLEETSGSNSAVIPCFNSFGYPTTELRLGYYDIDNIANSLSNDKPVYMTAVRRDANNEYKGHAWVIDGCRHDDRYYTYFLHLFDEDDNYNGWAYLYQSNVSVEAKVYCNFGWGGEFDGIFESGIFNIPGRNYVYEQKIITNISPN